MSTKAFLALVVLVLVVGGGVGGAFAGGVALGKTQGDGAPPGVAGETPGLQSPGVGAAGQPNQQTLDQLRQRIQSGEVSAEELEGLRQQFQGRAPGATGGLGSVPGDAGFAGGRGLTGTVGSVSEGLIVVDTPQGPLRAVIGEETVVSAITQGTLGDLESGVTVTVVGQRGEDGTVRADSILILPGEASGVRGRGGFGGFR